MRGERFTILHLSDPHFGPKNKYDEEYQKKYGEAWKESLQESLVNDIKSSEKAPDCIVLSGDLTQNGLKDQFDKARLFLQDLCKAFDLEPKEDLIVVPGNHDMQWKNGSVDTKMYDDFLHNLLGEGFVKDFHSIIRHFSKNMEIAILGLNSCMIESKSTAGIGAIGPRQLDLMDEQIKVLGLDKEHIIKICLLHHHLVPVNPVELFKIEENKLSSSITQDAEYALRWLIEHGFSLVLHGHQHRRFFGCERRIHNDEPNFGNEIIILGAGSIAYVPQETDDKFNSYYTIEIDESKRLRIETRESKPHWGFKSRCTYSIPLDVRTAITDVLQSIHKSKNEYLANFSSYPKIDKTVVNLLATLGAIRFEEGSPPVMNDFLDSSHAELGSSFVYSLLQHFRMFHMGKNLTLFKGWKNALEIDNTYSIRQIIYDCENSRMRFELNENLPISAIEEEYVLVVVAGRLIKKGDICCLLRWHRGWDRANIPAYLIPAHRPGPDLMERICLLDFGVDFQKLKHHLEVQSLEKFEDVKVSPRSAVLTKYSFNVIALKIDKEGANKINTEAKRRGRGSFNEREPQGRERLFRWFTHEECRGNDYMMETNEKVIESVFQGLKNLGDDFASFEVED